MINVCFPAFSLPEEVVYGSGIASPSSFTSTLSKPACTSVIVASIVKSPRYSCPSLRDAVIVGAVLSTTTLELSSLLPYFTATVCSPSATLFVFQEYANDLNSSGCKLKRNPMDSLLPALSPILISLSLTEYAESQISVPSANNRRTFFTSKSSLFSSSRGSKGDDLEPARM
ncbi:hypothetical protein D3C73_1213670 [compost metagenome]